MTPVLYSIFFLSGASGLVFESLWFRQAGLAFGSSVWASSLVLAGYTVGKPHVRSPACWRPRRSRSSSSAFAAPHSPQAC
jgi:hypothetical protein